jgi:mannosyltransferase
MIADDSRPGLARSLRQPSEWAVSTTALLLAIMAVAVALRIYRLSELSLWIDEGFTLWATRQNLAYIWQFIPTFDSHPPFYYTFLKGWTAIFGISEEALRGPSVIASVATVPVMWLAGRILGGPEHGRWVGLAAALLYALAPVQIRYAQEARSYAILNLATACAIASALWLATHPEAARRPLLGWGGGRTCDAIERHARLAWAGLVAGAGLVCWLHNLGPFLSMALGAAGLVWVWRDLRWDRHALTNGLIVLALIVLIWSPFALRFLAQSERFSQDLWIPEVDAARLDQILRFLFEVPYVGNLPTFWPLLALAVLGLVALARYGRSAAGILLAATMVLPILLSLLASVTVRPIFLGRTLLFTSVPFYLLVASSLLLLPANRTWLRGAAVAVVAAVFATGAVNYYTEFDKEPWRDLAKRIVREWKPNDLVVTMPEFQKVLIDYYAAKQDRVLPVFELPVPVHFPEPGIVGPHAIMDLERLTPQDVEALRPALPAEGRVWLVAYRGERYDEHRLVDGLLRSQGRKLLREKRLYASRLFFYLYGPPGSSSVK